MHRHPVGAHRCELVLRRLGADHPLVIGGRRITGLKTYRVGPVVYVKIETNRTTRESRLFRSIPDYLRRAGGVMFRPGQVVRGGAVEEA